MGRLERELDPDRFVRVHRSSIVQIDRVAELQPDFHGDFTLVLKNGTTLTLSRGYRPKLEGRSGARAVRDRMRGVGGPRRDPRVRLARLRDSAKSSVDSSVPELPDIVIYLEALTPRVVGQPLERLRIGNPFIIRTIEPPPQEFMGSA